MSTSSSPDQKRFDWEARPPVDIEELRKEPTHISNAFGPLFSRLDIRMLVGKRDDPGSRTKAFSRLVENGFTQGEIEQRVSQLPGLIPEHFNTENVGETIEWIRRLCASSTKN